MNTKKLSNALKSLAPCFKKPSKHKVLNGVKLVATSGVLYLAATDLATCKHDSLYCEGEFSAVVPYQYFKKLVAAMLKTGVATLVITQTAVGIELSDVRRTFRYEVQNIAQPEEYPIDIVAAVEPIAIPQPIAVAEPEPAPVIEPQPVTIVEPVAAVKKARQSRSKAVQPVVIAEPEPAPVGEPHKKVKKQGKIEADQPVQQASNVIPMKKPSKPLDSKISALVLTGDYATDLDVAQQLGIVAADSQPEKALLYATIAIYQGKKALIPVRARYNHDLNSAREFGLFGLTEKPDEDDLYQAIADFNIAFDELIAA